MHTYIHTYRERCIYNIYIYIERERGLERERDLTEKQNIYEDLPVIRGEVVKDVSSLKHMGAQSTRHPTFVRAPRNLVVIVDSHVNVRSAVCTYTCVCALVMKCR